MVWLSHMFENYVNYAGSKTNNTQKLTKKRFENYVNYAGSKTFPLLSIYILSFENYVNYAGSKTSNCLIYSASCLRTM